MGEETLAEVDVRNADSVEIPVVQTEDHGPFLFTGQLLKAQTEVAVTEFGAVEGTGAEVSPVMLAGMQEATDPLELRIHEAQVFTVVDGLQELRLRLFIANPVREVLEGLRGIPVESAK
jgi:hypothetical protein